MQLDDRFAGGSRASTSIAVLCALAGTAAFALNLVLGARMRFVEALFGGLERMYRVHRLTGQVAFALLAGHVVLSSPGASRSPSRPRSTSSGRGAGWTVFAGSSRSRDDDRAGADAVRPARAGGVRLRPAHFGFVFLLASYHVFTTDGVKASRAALNTYLAVLATLGIAAFVYRSLFGNVLVRRQPYRVTAVNRLDDS